MDLLEKEKHDEISQEDVQLAYFQLFTSPSAKAVWFDIMQQFSFFHNSTFVPGDPHSTSFNEGKREVFRYVAKKIEEGRKVKMSPPPKEDEEVFV